MFGEKARQIEQLETQLLDAQRDRDKTLASINILNIKITTATAELTRVKDQLAEEQKDKSLICLDLHNIQVENDELIKQNALLQALFDRMADRMAKTTPSKKKAAKKK